MVAAFYNCPKLPGLFQKSFCALYEAVHDVAFNPERHALSSQSQPLAASSSSIPAGEDAQTENVEMSSHSQPLAVDGSVLVSELWDC